MNILDTFYILYKSNADEVEKASKKAEKAGKDLDKGLNEADKTTKELAKSITKVVENLASAAAAYVTFGALKSGLVANTSFNAELALTSKLTGQNITDIGAYGAALEQFGGTAEGFQSSLKSMNERAAQMGRQLPPIAGVMKDINRQFQGLSLNESTRRAGLLGINDPAMLLLLQQTPKVFDEIIAKQKALNPITEKDGASALAAAQAWQNFSHSLSRVYNVLSEKLLPTFTRLVDVFGKWLSDNPNAAGGIMLGLAGAISAVAATLAGGGLISSLGMLGSVVGALATPWVALAAAITATTLALTDHQAVADALDKTSWGQGLGDLLYRLTGGTQESDRGLPRRPYKPSSASSPASSGSSKSSMGFWMAQGFTPEQAAGLAANEMAESSGRPGARNTSKYGAQYGLYQWSEDRRRKILAGTGIDVATAGVDEQRKAAAWELHQRGDDARVRATSTPGDAAEVVNRKFEVSDDYSNKRMMMAAQLATAHASSSPFSAAGSVSYGGNKSTSVRTGDIHVHTQATDPDGIGEAVQQGFQSHIKTVNSNYDDGIDG